MMGRRMMRRRTILGAAATVSMVSGARKNRAERKAIEGASQEAEQAPVQAVGDPTVEIKKYKDLLDQGIITQEEFNAKKSELLGL